MLQCVLSMSETHLRVSPSSATLQYRQAVIPSSDTKQCHQAVPPSSETNEDNEANAYKDCLAAKKDAAEAKEEVAVRK